MQYPEGHVSRSIYAVFRMVSAPPSTSGLLNEFLPDLGLAVWTTTPWTVPANAGKSLFSFTFHVVVLLLVKKVIGFVYCLSDFNSFFNGQKSKL